MYSNQIISKEDLDQEWLHLVVEAKKAGLTTNEIRDFLKRESNTTGVIPQLQQKNA